MGEIYFIYTVEKVKNVKVLHEEKNSKAFYQEVRSLGKFIT